jgi:hypothetical protein
MAVVDRLTAGADAGARAYAEEMHPRGNMKRLLVTLAFSSALSSAACARPSDFRTDNVALRLHCPESQVTITDVGDTRTRRAEGCGRSEMYTQVPPFGEWIVMQDLRKRAAFDLGCAADALTLEPLSTGRQLGVRGCNKKVAYTYVQISRDQYDWQMDGPVMTNDDAR